MIRRMKGGGLGVILILSFYGICSAGILFGRIIMENGMPLGRTIIAIEGNKIMTNEFGGYRIELPDGERELNVEIHDASYTSEKIRIFSPRTKQNWRIDYKKRRLIRIR